MRIILQSEVQGNREAYKKAEEIARTIPAGCRRRAAVGFPYFGSNQNGMKLVIWRESQDTYYIFPREGIIKPLDENEEIWYYRTVN